MDCGGTEFGAKQGNVMFVVRALYGLTSSRAAFRDLLFSFFLFDRSLCSYRVLIVMWWILNSRTDSMKTIDSAPIKYLIRYCISHVFGSCLLTPTSTPLPIHSPLPCTLLPLLSPLIPLGPVTPDTTIS